MRTQYQTESRLIMCAGPDLGPGTFAFEGIGTGGKQLIVGRAVDPETGDFVLDESYDWVNVYT